MAKKTVLLVEDNAPTARLVSAVLADEPYELVIAADGEEALAVIRRRRPDLVLCDIDLPKVNGFEVLRQVRTDPELRRVQVVAFSVGSTPDDLSRIRAAGFDGSITKPIEPAPFAEELARFLHRHTA